MVDAVPDWLWVIFTLAAAFAQTLRNATQSSLNAQIGVRGATSVRFIYGVPFALAFLAIVHSFFPGDVTITTEFLAWTAFGAVSQITATGLMLAAMQSRSLVTVTAYTRTEPMQIAIFGLIFLGDPVTLPLVVAIVIATTGVIVLSFPKLQAELGAEQGALSWRPAALGIVSATFFAFAAIGYRGGIQSLGDLEGDAGFVLRATTTLATGLALQTAICLAYFAMRDRAVLVRIVEVWRPSLLAGFTGALASQFWFLSFALTTAANVRTLAFVEILFAGMIGGRFLGQSTSRFDWFGIALIVVGALILINGTVQ